ncbi:MAG: arsenate reductase ArsC [Dehalococcoidia bacterium]|nr:arsenate reductase ArsC [Dehalococcoidia bacterium]
MQVLFVCVHNAGRSQMAEAIFNALSGGRHHAMSGGTMPGSAVNPQVGPVLAEIGVALGSAAPKPLDPALITAADRTITMGCGVAEACPAGLYITEDWGLDDPAGQPLPVVRAVRDQIAARVKALIDELDREVRAS